ncbi:MAG: SusD/RagB family nutrient-binding outer membrane lipoprotein [Carboxylicivirga sp.]|jgi:hypothetical protein|nr:SusD/RagB family nutrient-binding outer membrane lipoprotein [Carboxylicivirga sp.]
MKKLNIYLLGALIAFVSACTDEFESINNNPNRVEEIDPGLQFGGMQLSYAGNGHEEWRGNLIMTGPLAGITQCGYRNGQGFTLSDSYSEAKWSALYTNAIKNGNDMLRVLKEKNSDGVNDVKIAQTTIMLQITFQRLTDLYGDIPYSEAGNGYTNQVFFPVYDSQEDVYKGMISQLKSNRDLLLSNDAEPFGSNFDIMYGHLSKADQKKAWARLANSMLLRIGMRASSADNALAKETVEEAAAHTAGFITNYENNNAALVTHSTAGGPWGIHENGTGSAINGKVGGFAYAYLGEEYLRLAQQNKDPRLFYTACQVINQDGEYIPWTGQTHFNPFEESARPGEPYKSVVFFPERGGATESFSVRGMMEVNNNRVFCDYFIDANSLGSTKVVDEGSANEYSYVYDADFAQFHTLCGVNPETVGSRTAYSIVFGGEESYFILAEAAAKGWSVSGDAASNLKKAVEISLAKYPELYGEASSPSVYMAKYKATTGDGSTYEQLSANYVNNLGTATEEVIHLERWKSLFLNGYEAFALWNRTLVSVTPEGIPYSTNIQLPKYNWDDIKDAAPGVEVTPNGYFDAPFHNGGVTGGVRPRRLDYPNAERMNNTDNINTAMERQANLGNDGDNFVTTKMWISK